MRYLLLNVFVVLLSTVCVVKGDDKCYSQFTNGQYIGCFEDKRNRALGDVLTISSSNSVPFCIQYCGERNYALAGVEYAKECFCGNDFAHKTEKPESECNMQCTGSNELCGGSWRLSVYSTQNIRKNNYNGQYIGCFEDKRNRALGDALTISSSNSEPFCIQYCEERNYALAGVEYSKECFCGNDFAHKTEKPGSECNMQCTGSGEFCGGFWRISVYSTRSVPKNDFSGQYIGCFEDKRNRALGDALTISSSNSVSFCIQYCEERNYALAGVEYSKECFCGNEFAHKTEKPGSECNMQCTGSDEFCGGSWRISVYSTKNVPKNDFNGQYFGCFEDKRNRALGDALTISSSNSVSFCIQYCGERNYALAGVEYAKECFCGNEFAHKTEKPGSECNMKCTGSDEFCGGSWRISVYSTKNVPKNNFNEMAVNYNDDCNVCQCTWENNQYTSTCKNVDCPPLSCQAQEQLPGECCPSCKKGCSEGGTEYGKNDVVPSKDACKTCVCTDLGEKGYEIICSVTLCVPCPHGVIKDGTCCGVCKEEEENKCDTVKCPIPDCKPKYRVKTDNTCCEKCMCRVGKQYVNPGPYGDDCDNCVCENGVANCNPCPRVQCVDPVKMADSCCYTCPNGATCRDTKKKNLILPGQTLNIGKHVCQCDPNSWHPNAMCRPKKVKSSAFPGLKNYKDVVEIPKK